MKAILFLLGVVIGAAGLWFLSPQQRSPEFDGSIIDATYVLLVQRDDLEAFASGMPTGDGMLRSVGNALGGTDLTTVRHRGRCGAVREIEKYLQEFLGSDRYLCFEARYKGQ